MKTVTCGECKDFIKPSTSNRVTEGTCKSYEEGIKNRPSESKKKKAYDARGNCPFLYCTRRFCQKYKPIYDQASIQDAVRDLHSS